MLKSICREFGYREEWLRDGIEPKQPPKLEEDELAEYIEDLLSTESPTYTLIKSILNVYCKLDDKSRQIADSIIDKIIIEIKRKQKIAKNKYNKRRAPMNNFLMKPKIDFAFKEIMNNEKAASVFWLPS